jgi:hypothetical protein
VGGVHVFLVIAISDDCGFRNASMDMFASLWGKGVLARLSLTPFDWRLQVRAGKVKSVTTKNAGELIKVSPRAIF